MKELALNPNPVSKESLFSIYSIILGEYADKDGFVQLLADLENDFYIRFRKENNGYMFGSKILCDWWRRYYAF